MTHELVQELTDVPDKYASEEEWSLDILDHWIKLEPVIEKGQVF